MTTSESRSGGPALDRPTDPRQIADILVASGAYAKQIERKNG
jgi:hypothetical protein